MRLKSIALASLIIVLTALVAGYVFLPGTTSDAGGYVVRPGGNTDTSNMVDAKPVSYLDLPLWIQVAAIVDGLLIAIGIFGIAPAILGRLQNVLDNRNRRFIFDYVLKNPGCTPSEVTANGNMRNGTVKYHVKMLEQEGKIILQKMGKFTRLYKNSLSIDQRDRVITSHLRNNMSKNIIKAIIDEPGITNKGLSELFGLDKSTTHWYLQKFLTDGIVAAEADGKYKKYYVSPEVIEKLKSVLTA